MREENERLRRAATTSVDDAEVKRLKERLKDLEAANAQLMEKKESFDRLTGEFAAWSYSLKGKDERIAVLEGELALMTERRDALVAKLKEYERPRRFGAF